MMAEPGKAHRGVGAWPYMYTVYGMFADIYLSSFILRVYS